MGNIHHLWCQNTSRTVKCRECFIKLRHFTADCRLFLNNIYRETSISNIKRRLNTGNTTTAQLTAEQKFTFAKGAYVFTTKAGTFDNRFVMRASREATEIIGLTAATGVAIGMQEGGLSIGGADDKCISIYAANGALVAEHYGNGYVALASGTYVVKVDGHSAKMYVK